jgi:uncharacterized protein (TIGR03437 family)
MRRQSWIALAWIGSLTAQLALGAGIRSLRASGNGAEAYLVTDQPRKGLVEPVSGRLFRVSATGGLEQLAGNPPCFALFCLTTADDIAYAEPSSDGRILTYDLNTVCDPAVRCGVGKASTLYPPLPAGATRESGEGHMSPNGRFVVSLAKTGTSESTSIVWSDQQAGVRQSVSLFERASMSTVGRSVSDDGSYLTFTSAGVTVRRGLELLRSPRITGSITNASMDAAGRVVVYEVCCFPASQLRMYRTATNQDTVIAEGGGIYTEPTISSDGNRVAFLFSARGPTGPQAPPQIYLINVGGGAQALTREPGGVQKYALSDDGRFVWYTWGAGAIGRIDIATRETVQVLPPSGSLLASTVGAPGSALAISGSYASDVRFFLNGASAPIIAQGPSGLWIQLPWELPSSGTVALTGETSSPFLPLSAAVELRPRAISYAGGPYHQDWSSAVLYSIPARPGEFIHYYVLGVGPVDHPVASGKPSPSQPLSNAISPPVCDWEVAFAGLAPGLTGFYQLTLRVPNVSADDAQPACLGFHLPSMTVRPLAQ